MVKNIGYDKFETVLYGSPSGAVQVLFLWIGVLGVTLLPNNRSLIIMVLIIPPLIGNILLLKLPVDAGWGLIVASWLVQTPYFILTMFITNSIRPRSSQT